MSIEIIGLIAVYVLLVLAYFSGKRRKALKVRNRKLASRCRLVQVACLAALALAAASSLRLMGCISWPN